MLWTRRLLTTANLFRPSLCAKAFGVLSRVNRLSSGAYSIHPFRRHHCSAALKMSYIGISDAFDSGNIDFVEYSAEEGVTKIVLTIKPDP